MFDRPQDGPIERLPTELLSQIVGYFRPHASASVPTIRSKFDRGPGKSLEANLATLCLVSKRFYSVGTGYLYQSVSTHNPDQLFRFFRTVLISSDRATLVRSFAFNGWYGYHSDSEHDLFIDLKFELYGLMLPDRIDPAAQEAIGFLGFTDVSDVSQQKVLAAVLTLMSSVESLFLSGCTRLPLDLKIRAMPRWARPTGQGTTGNFWTWIAGLGTLHDATLTTSDSVPCRRILPRLSRVALAPGWGDTDGTVLFDELLISLLLHPQPLSRLELIEVRLPPGGIPQVAFAAARDVRELSICGRDMSSVGLQNLVTSFPNLVNLEIEVMHPYELPEDLNTDNSTSIVDSVYSTLTLLSDTLTSLTLLTNLKEQQALLKDMESRAVPPLLTRLDELTSLRCLTTETVWLFGRVQAEVPMSFDHFVRSLSLPPSLVRLHLIDSWGFGTQWAGALDRELPYYPCFSTGSPVEFYKELPYFIRKETVPNLLEIRLEADFARLICPNAKWNPRKRFGDLRSFSTP
ncbi:hypothetical protein QBC34DRAFT_430749 [Podospora aff. communis PSN243]|uniref:F-box domain-containing protein n=1 Tax=Podospora aff. communis PSN243 TaxID=3040156 RepID=A0AAV9G5X9_9PEZI|nr:hypothetical protein QBC34DRAFT_430749 [Podospora aff. communis PSN243]